MPQFENNSEWHVTAVSHIHGVEEEGMQKRNRKPKYKNIAREPEYIVSDFFTGRKTLKESLLALMIREMKKL